MPDFEMCSNICCPIRKECYRYLAVADPGHQKYKEFEPKEAANGGTVCSTYYPVSYATGPVDYDKI